MPSEIMPKTTLAHAGKIVCFERSYCWHFSWNYECFLRTLVITINHSYCYYGNECISIKNKGNVHGNWRSICRTAVGLYHSSACNKAKGQRVIKQAPTCSTASRAEFHLPHSTWPQNKIKKIFFKKSPLPLLSSSIKYSQVSFSHIWRSCVNWGQKEKTEKPKHAGYVVGDV